MLQPNWPEVQFLFRKVEMWLGKMYNFVRCYCFFQFPTKNDVKRRRMKESVRFLRGKRTLKCINVCNENRHKAKGKNVTKEQTHERKIQYKANSTQFTFKSKWLDSLLSKKYLYRIEFEVTWIVLSAFCRCYAQIHVLGFSMHYRHK